MLCWKNQMLSHKSLDWKGKLSFLSDHDSILHVLENKQRFKKKKPKTKHLKLNARFSMCLHFSPERVYSFHQILKG